MNGAMKPSMMNYTSLPLAEVRAGLDGIARETQATFGGFDARQLNWRPDTARWSVAQCFEHLLIANRLMVRAADDALDDARPRQRQSVQESGRLRQLHGQRQIVAVSEKAVRISGRLSHFR